MVGQPIIFIFGIHDVLPIGETKRTRIFNDRPFIASYLNSGDSLVNPYVFPHISITAITDRIIAWSNVTQSAEEWGVEPSAAKNISMHIGTVSITKLDASPYKGFLYGIGFYCLDYAGLNTDIPKGTVMTIKISGRYRHHNF